MYINIVHQIVGCLGVCIIVSGMIWLWLICGAGKIEDKKRADKIASVKKGTIIVDIDDYLTIDQTYDWKEREKETSVN